MSLFNQMKNIKEKVAFILETKPALRDDDNKLIASFYVYELGKSKVEQMSAMSLLTELAYGNLTSPESIRRVRQKLQEERKDLRGEKYSERIKDGDETKSNIKNL
jgi:hypothetical protein